MFNTLVKRLGVSNEETDYKFENRVYGTREQLTQWYERKAKAQLRLHGEVQSFIGFVMYDLSKDWIRNHSDTIKDLEHIK